MPPSPAGPSQRATHKELFQAAQHNDFTAVSDYLQVVLHDASSSTSTKDDPKSIVQTLCEPKTGNTLLHYACDNGNLDACKFLLMCDGMSDAFLNEPNKFGHTPLFYAASSGQLPLVKWLISNGADIDMDYSDRNEIEPRDGDQGIFTPLQIACFKGHDEIVDFLVECNAALTGTRRNGKTPLHLAAAQNHKAIVRVLLEAGADVHACDDEGKTPVDVAPASLLPVLLPEEHGRRDASEDEEDDDGLDRGRGKANDRRDDDDEGDDEDDDDGFGETGPRRAAMESIRAALGHDIARDFRHKSWKRRVRAIQDAHARMQNGSKNATRLFDGACQMIVLALQDAVSQVVSSCCTALLKSAFNIVMTMPDFHSSPFHHDRPVIQRIADLLLLRGAGSNEKDASEAVASLLFLICKSTDITRHLTSHISLIMLTAPSSVPAITPSKATTSRASNEDGMVPSGAGTVSWRLQLVAIKILNTIASQYRLDDVTSGLSFTDAIKISTLSLENASVHVRTAAIDLLVQCLLIRCERSDMTGTVEEIYEQIKSWSEAIFKQQNQPLKPSIQAKINTGLKNALQKSKRLNSSGGGPESDKKTTSSGKQSGGDMPPLTVTMPLDLTAPGAVSPRSKGAQKEDDLPYAEPIQEQYKDEAALLQQCFGEKVTRCLFSNAWAPRVEALSLLQFQVETKHTTFDVRLHKASGALSVPLQAMQRALLLALQDRVNSVYEAGVALLMEVAIAINTATSTTATSAEKMAIQELFRPLIPRLLSKLGDTKARLHVVTEDALLLLSRQSSSLGPEFLLDEMIACDRNASPQALSATYLSNKLSIISKLLLEFGIKESSDTPSSSPQPSLPIKPVLQSALQVFEHRDPSVRNVAIQIVADTMQTARSQAMPFLDALARASRQKIISKLVEKGVLESDLLMDEVDDFEIHTEPLTARPGTSGGGIRPPTASASSTKHRPALSNASLSTAPTSSASTTSASYSAQAPALPYGTALTNEQKMTYQHLLDCFGDALVRCLLDKAWAQREAAIREIERLVVCTANGKLPTDKALPKTPETLRTLSQCVELGLNDTVARVFQCTLRVCQLIATEFMPLITTTNSDDSDAFLERVVRAALYKLGDTKQRLRADCVTLLHSLASLGHIGQARLCRILAREYHQLVETSSSVASSPLIGAELFKLFTVLIRDGFATTSGDAQRPELGAILELMLPAFENKHVDVRHAAIDAYGTIYEVTNGGTSIKGLDLGAFLDQVKQPAIKEAIARKVVQVTKPTLSGSGGQDESDMTTGRSGLDSARQQPLALDINKLKHVCSQEIVDLLTSVSATARCQGVDRLMQLFVDAPRNPHFKGAWEIACLLCKQLLLDGTPSVCLAAFQLLRLLVDPRQQTPEYAIPWGEWGVHLILGSTIRSVMQQSANPSVRVRVEVQALLELVATKNAAGKNAVCNAILSAPEQRDLSNEPSKQQRKIALCKLRWQMLVRLELMDKLMQHSKHDVVAASISKPVSSSSGAPSITRRKSSSSSSKMADSLSVENVVPFLGSCVVHPSPLVRSAAKKIMTTLKSTRDDEVVKFISEECSPSLQRRLQALLLTDDGEDESDNNMHADHFNADETTVVRGSRASHVRRIAALRPPRSVPIEEKSMTVDVFPPPHSAPGKSRRAALHHGEESEASGSGDEFGDYVVKPRQEPSHRPQKTSTGVSQEKTPIWLDSSSSSSSAAPVPPRKTSGNSFSFSDPHHNKRDGLPGEMPEASSALAVGGGAANLVKVRRRSSVRSNNGEDEDSGPVARSSSTTSSRYTSSY